jgi:drug/metabolite transporter (DMT)-like permease
LWSGVVLAAVGSVAFSGKAIIVKLAYRHGVDATTLIMLRMLFALPFFACLAWWGGRGKPKLTRQEFAAVLSLGFSGYYLASFLDFVGLSYISAALERLILYLNPTFVLCLGWLLYRRGIGAPQIGGVALSYLGVLLVLGHEIHRQGSHTVLGALFVLGSAISYAFYISFSGVWVHRLGALRLVGWATTVACVLCLAQFWVPRPFALPQVAVLWLSVCNAIFCTVVPVLLMMLAIERIGAGLAAQVGMLGPMSTLFLGVLFLDEGLTAWVVAGTVLVLLGIFVFSRGKFG